MKNIKFARRMQDAEPSIIREMLKLSLDPSYISFAGEILIQNSFFDFPNFIFQ